MLPAYLGIRMEMKLKDITCSEVFVTFFPNFFTPFGRYDGSIGSASRAMVAVDQFTWQLGRKNL
jgi:hypothetical protein